MLISRIRVLGPCPIFSWHCPRRAHGTSNMHTSERLQLGRMLRSMYYRNNHGTALIDKSKPKFPNFRSPLSFPSRVSSQKNPKKNGFTRSQGKAQIISLMDPGIQAICDIAGHGRDLFVASSSSSSPSSSSSSPEMSFSLFFFPLELELNWLMRLAISSLRV